MGDFTLVAWGLLVGILVAAAVAARGWLRQDLGARPVRFHCPWAGRSVTAQFAGGEADEPVSVLFCTAYQSQEPPSCGRMCVGGDRAEGLASGERRAGDLLAG